MALWNYCAICGKRIETGDPFLGVEKKNAETAGDSICFDCVKIENINGLDKTVSITDLLARTEAAESRAEKAEREVERLKGIMRSEGIMVIPSKYPGCKSEWNLPKCGQKEE